MSRLDRTLTNFALQVLQTGSIELGDGPDKVAKQQAVQEAAKYQIKGIMLDIIGPHRQTCVVNQDRASRLTMDTVVRQEQDCDCGVYEMGLKVAAL